MTPPVLALHGASFGYADVTVVHGIDLVVEPGEVVALVGPNGSGKSTLVRGVLGLVPLVGGTVSIFGTPAQEFTDHTRLGYVPQRLALSASVRATSREVVAVGRVPRRPWWRPAGHEDRRLVDDALRDVGLLDRADTEVDTLSGGQQRRILIARALAGEPDAIVMDEPTAGIDPANQAAFADVLGRLVERGVTLVIVTHELEALAEVATRVVCLRDGRVDFDGAPAAYARHEAAHTHGHGHHHAEDTDHQAASRTGAAAHVPLDPHWRNPGRA